MQSSIEDKSYLASQYGNDRCFRCSGQGGYPRHQTDRCLQGIHRYFLQNRPHTQSRFLYYKAGLCKSSLSCQDRFPVTASALQGYRPQYKGFRCRQNQRFLLGRGGAFYL